MKNRGKLRLTRAEKIAQSSAIRRGHIREVRHLIDLPPGSYTVSGEAAAQIFGDMAKRMYQKHGEQQ